MAKTVIQKAGANDVIHIVDLRNIPKSARPAFMADVIKGAGSPDGIEFINK